MFSVIYDPAKHLAVKKPLNLEAIIPQWLKPNLFANNYVRAEARALIRNIGFALKKRLTALFPQKGCHLARVPGSPKGLTRGARFLYY